MQVLASMVKVPLLFYLTLLVTFPSLYVFNALVGSRLRLGTVVRLLVASLGVMVAVLASLGPIVAFFSVSTASYPFMLLFNVAVYTVAGMLGLAFLLQTLHRLSVLDSQPRSAEPGSLGNGRAAGGARSARKPRTLSKHVKTVFRLWVIVFALVGAQMGWVLRPFVGNPAMPFAWFRAARVQLLPGGLPDLPESCSLDPRNGFGAMNSLTAFFGIAGDVLRGETSRASRARGRSRFPERRSLGGRRVRNVLRRRDGDLWRGRRPADVAGRLFRGESSVPALHHIFFEPAQLLRHQHASRASSRFPARASRTAGDAGRADDHPVVRSPPTRPSGMSAAAVTSPRFYSTA